MAAIVFLILAVASAAYGACVLSLQSGTPFYAVWFGLAALFLLAAAAFHFGWTSKLPAVAQRVIICLVAVVVVVGGVETAFIASNASQKAEPGLDYLIVLGAQVRADHSPTAVLQYRLDAAADYLADNPSCIAIVSGAQGYNEPCTEAQAMAEYLEAKGIEPQRIIQEPQAQNTQQNIAYSKQIIAQRETGNAADGNADGNTGGNASNSANASSDALTGPRIGIVTNDFHVFRGVSLAKKQGLDAYGISAYSTPFFLPNNVLREFFGITKDFLSGNL